MSIDDRSAANVHIRGEVQGVGFRYHTQSAARDLGVSGWVRNEPDGSVRGHFEGSAYAVGELFTWCHTGPSSAEVRSVDVEKANFEGIAGFSVDG